MPMCYRLLCLSLVIALLSVECTRNNGIPVVLSVSPTIDTVGGVVTITGTGFSATTSENIVLFNDSTQGTVLTATTTQLTVVVPPYNTRNQITVRTNGVERQTAQVFQIAPKFSPQSEAPGYPITIITGGGPNVSDYSISFNGAQATPSKVFLDMLTVVVPSGAHNGTITVTYKGQPYTSFTNFTVAPAGEVSNVTTTGGFGSPAGLAFDKDGNLFVADVQGGVIDKVDPATGSVSAYAGNGTYNDNGGSPLLSAGVYGAYNLAFSSTGDLYSTNTWYDVMFRITGNSVVPLSPIGATGTSPTGLYIDASDNLYITAGLQIKKMAANGTFSVLAGQGTQGWNEGPAATALFFSPSSLTMDAAGTLFIADGVKIRQLSNGIVSTFAGGGVAGYQDGTGVNTGFTSVASIIRDPGTGNFYVTDPGDHVVRMITPAGVVTTIAGKPGEQGSQNGTGSAALFQGPVGIALDKSGNIYVSDGSFSNSSIRKIVLH